LRYPRAVFDGGASDLDWKADPDAIKTAIRNRTMKCFCHLRDVAVIRMILRRQKRRDII
jgi:hypothetical protein